MTPLIVPAAPVIVNEGSSPVILAFAHDGRRCPEGIKARLNSGGLKLADTDWHIHRLYDNLLPQATVVRATFHRYLIDANRDPGGDDLYPGQNSTGLCPLTDFDGQPIWRQGQAPGAAEIERRRLAYHAPYHRALAAQIERVRRRHGVALLYDCHSIRSEISHLFEGVLPDFNIGSNDGKTCAAAITDSVRSVCRRANGFSHVLDGRFKGGWTVRHYGRPERGVHAVQMELAQSTYLIERSPWTFENIKASRIRAHLKAILKQLETLALTGRIPAGGRNERPSS